MFGILPGLSLSLVLGAGLADRQLPATRVPAAVVSEVLNQSDNAPGCLLSADVLSGGRCMNRRYWEVIGVGMVLVLLTAIGAMRLVQRTTLNRELVARLDRTEWRAPQLR
jgi:hypothetical protein